MEDTERIFVLHVSLVILGVAWLGFLGRSVSMVLVFIMQMLLGKTSKRSSGVRALVGHIVALTQLFIYFCFVTVATIISRIVQYLPFLVFVFLLSTVYNNYSEGLLAVMESYNNYIVKTEFFRGIKVVQNFGRIVFEVVTPAANFVVDFFRIVPVEVLRLLLDQSMLNDITKWTTAVASLLTDVVLAAGNFILRERNECADAAVVQSFQASQLSIAPVCLDADYRSVALYSDDDKYLGEIAQYTTNIVERLCPLAASPVSLLLFPLAHPDMGRVLDAALNAVVSIVYTTWRMCTQRCQIALLPGNQRTSLCAPDLGPFFVHVERTVHALGLVLDAWIEAAFEFTLMLYVERKPAALGGECGSSTPVPRDLDASSGHVLALDGGLYATVKADSATFYESNAEPYVRKPTNTTFVDLRYGVVPIDYDATAGERVAPGRGRTSAMGCRCRNDLEQGPLISCPVFTFDAQRTDADDDVPEIPVVFADATPEARRNIRCSQLHISVQPLARDLAVRDVGAGLPGGCLAGGEGCAFVDAAVYVMLECGTGIGMPKCVEDAENNLCAPFCVGVRQMGAGMRPIFLSNAATLFTAGGQVLLNILCLPDAQDGSDSIASFSAQGETTPIKGFVGSNSYSRCDYSVYSTTLKRKLDEIRDSIAKFTAAINNFIEDGTADSSSSGAVSDETSDVFDDDTGFGLPASVSGVPKTNLNGRAKFVRGVQQPFVFAGQYMLYENRTREAADGFRNAMLARLELTTANSITLRTVMQNIPIPDNLVPDESMSLLQQHNLGASMPGGVIFYAINPDLDGLSGLFVPGSTAIRYKLEAPRLVRIDPLGECSGGRSIAAQTTRFCGPKLVQSVPLFDNAWREDSTLFLRQLWNQDFKTDLYIDAVSRISDTHLLVTVRHGPLCALGIEIAERRTDKDVLDCVRMTSIKTLYVNATGLTWKNTAPAVGAAVRVRDAVFCDAEHRLPPVFGIASGFGVVALRSLKVVVNDFVVNGIGIIEDLVTSKDACHGGALLHSAYDHCSTTRPRPLSLLPVHAAVVELHVAWRLAVERVALLAHRVFYQNERQMEKFLLAAGLGTFGPEAAPLRTILAGTIARVLPASLNVAAALPRIAGEAAMLSLYYGTFVYDYYVLPLGTYLLQKLAREEPVDGLWQRTVATHYSVMTGGAFNSMVMVPLERTCSVAAQLAYDPQNPVGRALFYGCRASIESVRLVLTVVADVLVIPNVANCVCEALDTNNDNVVVLIEQACGDAMPDNLKHTYIGMIQDAQVDFALSNFRCLSERSNIRRRLFAAPTRLVRLVTRFGDALADTVAFLPSLTNLAGLEARECARPERNVDGTVMLPQPLVSFMACGLTPACRTKCGPEITWFEERRAREDLITATTFHQNNTDTFLPVFGPQGGDVFVPIVAQAYARPNEAWNRGEYACMYDIVVITKPMGPVGQDWSVRVFCMQTEIADNLELVQVEVLRGTAYWYTAKQYGLSDKNRTHVEMLTLAPKLYNAQGLREFSAVLYVQTYHAATYSTHLHRFSLGVGSGAVVRYELLMTGANILPIMIPVEDTRKLFRDWTGNEDFHDGYSIADPTEEDQRWNQRLRNPVVIRATQQENDLSVHYAAQYRCLIKHTSYSDRTLNLNVVAQFHVNGTVDVVLRIDRSGSSHLIPNLYSHSLVFSDITGTNIYVLQNQQFCIYSVHEPHILHNMTVRNANAACKEMDTTRGESRFRYYQTRFGSTLLVSPDQDDDETLRVLRANVEQASSSSDWLSEVSVQNYKTAPKMIIRRGITTLLKISYEKNCTYMTCNECPNLELRQICQAAQNCAISECIGTKVHMQNVFCSLGLLVREVGDLDFKDFLVLWQGFVELLSTTLEGGRPLTTSGNIEIEALSSMLVTTMCESKDILAVGSTVLPTLVTTISTAVKLQSSSPGTLRNAYRKMSMVLSPADGFLEMEKVLAASQFLYQIALGYVQYMYVNARILMCGVRSFSMLVLGKNIFVDHDVNPEGDVCSLMLADESYVDQSVQNRISELTSSFRLTTTGVDSVQDARRQSLVSPGTSMSVGVSTTIASVFIIDKGSQKLAQRVCSGRSCPSSKSLKMLPDRRVILFYFTALFDFITGLLYGIAGVGKVTQEEKCSLRPKVFDTALECVCNDRPVFIAPHAEKVPHDFWCRGILRMIDRDGRVQYIWQNSSYSSLVQKYERDGKEYLDCVVQYSEEDPHCQNLLRKINHPFDTVSPLAVIMRCRENFFLKRWDPGLFAAFHAETKNKTMLGDAKGLEILSRAESAGLTRDSLAAQCLVQGPELQDIERCTKLFFQSSTSSFEASNLNLYFRYQDSHPHSFTRLDKAGDACEFMSGDAADDKKLEKCNNSALMPTYRALADDEVVTCNISTSTRILSAGRQENAVESFLDNTQHLVTDEHYKRELQWISKYLGTDSLIPSIADLGKYSMQLHSFEGDLVHFMMDCMVQGPYREFSFLPADPTGLAANLSYRRPSNYTSCDKPEIMDTKAENGPFFKQNSCGSPTRIALINAYLHKKEDEISTLLQTIIRNKIETLKQDFDESNSDNFKKACVQNENDCIPDFELKGDFFKISVQVILEQAENMQQFLHTNIQEHLTRFQTAEHRASLNNYANFREVLQGAQVSYAANGTLHGDKDEYDWPLDKISIQEQCEQLLSTKIWSTRTEQRGDFLSLEALNNLFDPETDDEWRPYDINTMDTRTRENIVHYLRDFGERDHPLADMYDIRLIPLNSYFCDKQPVSNDGPVRTEIKDFKKDLQEILGVDGEDISENFADIQRLLGWQSNESASIASIKYSCPCIPIDYKASDSLLCGISAKVCEIVPEFLPELVDECEGFELDSEVLVYDAAHARRVREVLRDPKHADALRKNGFVCPTFLPSNLWKFGPNTRDFLLHGASGVTATNLDFVTQKLGSVLGEDHRTVAFENLSIPLCQGDTDPTRMEDMSFPAAHIVAVSPAVVACVRYVVDSIWVHALRETSASNVEDAEAAAQIWRTRCEAKVNKLESCRRYGAYDLEITSIHSNDDCPYETTSENLIMRPAACLVQVGDNFYDPFKCKECLSAKSGQRCVIDQSEIIEKCKIANPLRILTRYTDEVHAHGVPGLSNTFVQDVLHRKDSSVRDLLFPETGADTTRWFKVWLDADSHTALGTQLPSSQVFDDRLDQNPDASEITLTDEEASLVRGGHQVTSHHYFRKGDFGWFPKALVADIGAHDHKEHGACFHSLPYWPPTWQAPLGESMSERADDAAGFANYLAVVKGATGAEVRDLHRVLHSEDESERYYGTTGVCREHNIGMPLADLNTHHVCTTDTQTNREVCSKSAQVDTGGGGFGKTLGPLFHVLRFWLDTDAPDMTRDDFWKFTRALDRATGDNIPEDNVAELLRTQCDTFPERLDAVLRELEYQATDHECNTTAQCEEREPGTVCHADARCRGLEVDVVNEAGEAVEMGFASPGCDTSPEISGASAWKRARHFLAQHGMCAHRNSITYERMLLALNNSNNTYQECELRTHGNWSYFECARNTTEWDWIRENPRWWARKAGPGVLPGEPEYDMRSVGDLGEFDLDPHPCDYDVMHAHDWGFCEATHTDDAQAAYSYWMRLAASHDNFTVYRDREDAARDEISEDNDGWNKLRFLGLEKAALKREKAAAEPRIAPCRNFGYCEAGDHHVGGVQVYRYLLKADSNTSVFYEMDNVEWCGPMGYLVQTTPTRKCALDPAVTQLFLQATNRSRPCSNVFGKARNVDDIFLDPDAPSQYLSTDRDAVRLYVNEYFSLQRAENLQARKSRAWHEDLNKCARDVATEGRLHLDKVRTGHPKQPLPVNVTPGIYLFLEYAAAEVPVLWWHKYALERALNGNTLGSEVQYRADVLQSRAVAANVAAYRGRGSLPASGTKLGTMWASLNTAKVFDRAATLAIFFKTTARWLKKSLQNNGDRLSFARPHRLALSSRMDGLDQYDPTFMNCFEAAVFPHAKDGTGVLPHVCHSRLGTRRNNLTLTLRDQFYSPYVTGKRGERFGSLNAMFALEDSPEFFEGTHDILDFLEILVRFVYENELTSEQKRFTTTVFDPYTMAEVVDTVEDGDKPPGLPILHIAPPDSDLWVTGIENQLENSIVEFLDGIDSNAEKHTFVPKSDILPDKVDENSECLFSMVVEGSGTHLSKLERGENVQEKTWKYANFSYDDNKQRSFNLCNSDSNNDRAFLTYGNRFSSKGPLCTFGDRKMAVGDMPYSLFTSAEDYVIEMPGSMNPSECIDEKCCPDHILYNRTIANNDNVVHDEHNNQLSFASLYRSSNAKYIERQKTKLNARCIRTDSACFAPNKDGVEFAKNAWKSKNARCRVVNRMDMPSIFKVKAFGMREEEMRLRDLLLGDRILLHESRNNLKRVLFSLKDSKQKRIMAAPPWSFCPDSTDSGFFMHKFRKIDLSSAKEKYSVESDFSNLRNFDSQLKDHLVYIPKNTIFDSGGLGVPTHTYASVDHTFSVLQKLLIQEDRKVTQYSSVQYTAMDAELNKFAPMWCKPGNPENSLMSVYQLGLCFDDLVFADDYKTKNRTTICEYLGRSFESTYMGYFARTFLGTRDIFQLRVTDFMHPINPDVPALKKESMNEEELWSAIAQGLIPRDELGNSLFPDFEDPSGTKIHTVTYSKVMDAFMEKFCKTQLYGGDKWDENCDLLRETLPRLYRRHLLNNFKWLKGEQTSSGSNHLLAPCIVAKSSFRDLEDYPSSKRISPSPDTRNPFLKSMPGTDNIKQDCWDACGRTEGLCPQFCGGGACCQGYLPGICNWLHWEDGLGVTYKHSCREIFNLHTNPKDKVREDTPLSPAASLLPALDVAMDYIDSQGWCKNGGSRKKIDFYPDQWSEVDRIVRSKQDSTVMWIPCDPKCELSKYQQEEQCKHCQSLLEKIVLDVEDTEDTISYKTTEDNKHVCSIELTMDEDYVCGADLSFAYKQCRHAQNGNTRVEVYTDFKLNSQTSVGWHCRKCLEYKTGEFRDFATSSGLDKLSWGLYFNDKPVYSDVDSQSALAKLKVALQNAIRVPEKSRVELEAVLGDENRQNSVKFQLRQEDDDGTRYQIYYNASEMQHADPLPLAITDSFREFGHEPPQRYGVGCELEGAQQQEDDNCGVPFNDVDTALANSASEQLKISLLGGCRAQEQDTQVHKGVCTKYVADGDTRYRRIKAFHAEVLSRAFALRLPEVAADGGSARLNIKGANWLRGVLAYYAYSSRPGHRPDAVYLDYIFDDAMRCKDMYSKTLLERAPCFEDHNGTVNLLNPWLGGNYSFIKYFANFVANNPDFDNKADVKNLLQAGYDTCTQAQTVEGENLQPCQGFMCIPLQSMSAIHPDDVNRTVCRFSSVLNNYYKQYELLRPKDLEIQSSHDNLEDVYHTPDTPTLCDAEYKEATAGSICGHEQATLGFAPAQQRGRATPAPSLNRSRTDAAQRVAEKIAVHTFRVGRASMQALLWAGTSFDRELHGDKPYFALQVDPGQTAPARVRLKVTRARALLVDEVSQLDSGTQNPGVAWVANQHVGVVEDQNTVRDNGLYHTRSDGPRHWACPLFVREAVTGARYPALQVLQPDPTQARAAFPGLEGAHPALRTRPVLPAQLARYRMLGLHRVVPEASRSATFTQEDARALARAFLRNNGTMLEVERSHSGARTACLRWPNVHPQSAELRSREDYSEQTACPQEHESDLSDVFAGRTLVRVSPENDILSAQDAGGKAAAPAHACFRAPLVVLTSEQFARLNGDEFLRCRDTTVGRTLKERNISCWTSKDVPVVFTFPTTYSEGRDRKFWESTQRTESAPCWADASSSTTQELSLHARQRLSPLRARLRRANLTHREPLQVWAQGVRRLQEEGAFAPQPVAALNTSVMGEGGLCDSSVRGTSLDMARWDRFAHREQVCREQYNMMAQHDNCSTSNTFIDLCDFAELRGMCATLRGAMQYFLRLNMAGGGHLLRTRMHYMPDRYMHGDGEFASTAVVAKYRDLATESAFVCQDWRFADEDLNAELQNNDRVHRDTCVETLAATLMQRMAILRQVAMGIIDFVLNFTQLIVDILMYIGLAIFGGTSSVLSGIRDNLGASIVAQLEVLGLTLLELLKDIADTLIQLFIDLFLSTIQAAIVFICGIIESIAAIILEIIYFFRKFFQDETLDTNELRDFNFCYNGFERWTGNGFAAEPAQSLIADQCFAAIPGVGIDLPSGFLNNPKRRFTCGLTSMCLRDSLAVYEENRELALSARGKYDYLPAIPCGRCPDRVFACDSMQKRCKCGVTIPAASACQTTAFCRNPGNDAVCRFSNDGDPDFSTLAQRCADINDRFIACVYSSLDADGQCQALPAATAQSIGPSNMYGVVRPFSFFDTSDTCESIESFGIVPSSTLLPFSPTSRCVRIGMDSKFNVPMYDMGLGGRARRLLAIADDYINMTAVASTFVLGIDVVLEPASPRTRSGDLNATAEDPGTGMTFENHDRIAGLNSTAAARRLLAAMAFQHLNFSALEAFRDTLSLSQSAGVDFTLLPLTNCTSSRTVQFEFFLRNFAEQLAGPRWRARPECRSDDPSLLKRLTQPCPVVQNVFDRLANNTAVLAQYYLHVTNSDCLDVNLDKSCVPEINRTKRESASELWPWFPEHDYRRANLKQWNVSSDGCGDSIPLHDSMLRDLLDERGEHKQAKSMFELSTKDQSNITTMVSMYHCVKSAKRAGFAYLPTAVEASNFSANQSVAMQSITSAVNFITVDVFALNQQYYSSLFFNVISLEAMHNDDEYERMVERHEYSVGRMVRDFTTCSYRDTVFCPQQQHSLLLCFVTMFVFLLLVTSLLPIPSVLTFFMWTLGLTVGVVYLAYGFSPLCAPLVPNCLGDGLRDTLVFFFPKNLTLPSALVDTSVCDINGKRLPGQTGDCLKSCRTLNVYGALDVLMHAEAFFTSGIYFGLTWEPAKARQCEEPSPELQDFMTANVKGNDTVVLRARDHAQALKDLPAGALRCNITYCAKGVGSPAWRPVGGLPVTDVIVHAVRRVLEPWIGSEDALWVDLRDKECHALENVHTEDNDQRLGVFICMLLGVFDVLAWGIVLLLGIPVFIYVVQYFVLLNLVLLQIFMDNYIVANREF